MTLAENNDADRIQSAAERPDGFAGDARTARRRGRGDRLRPSAPAKADNGERVMFSGSTAEIKDDLRVTRELGVKAIDFNFTGLTVDAMREFHEEVVAKSP